MWDAAAYLLAKKLERDALHNKFDKGVEAIKEAIDELGERLEAAIDEAVRVINAHVKQSFNDAWLAELTTRTSTLLRLLDEYLVAPTQLRLELMTHDSMFVVEGFKTVPFPEHYKYAGLQGHTGFMVAANVRAAILHERIKQLGPADKPNLITHLEDAITHATDMKAAWYDWHCDRFSELKWNPNPIGFPKTFYYLFEGVRVDTKVKVPWPNTGSEFKHAYAQAEALRQHHIANLWTPILAELVDPSMMVVKKWKLELENLHRVDTAWIDALVGMPIDRRVVGAEGPEMAEHEVEQVPVHT